MLKTLAAAGLVAALAGCAVAPGYYDYGYGQPAYYSGYAPAYEPAYGSVNIGIWGGGGGRDYYGGRGRPWHDGGHGGWWRSGGGHGAGHGGGGHSGHGR